VAVAKRVARDVTTATATVLDDEQRTAEIARMLSGDDSSEVAREHAADLLRRRHAAKTAGGKGKRS
jgi:DNA repair ATPase RecN